MAILSLLFFRCNLHQIIKPFSMKTSDNILHWTPRILCILAILFLSMFALDSFSPERTFWQNTSAFLMHLIPSFALLAVLVIAWKREITGGIILTIVGLAFCIFIFVINFKRTHSATTSLLIVLTLSIPFVLAGILFILSGFRKKKELTGDQ
jgi:hypothetical protein